MDTNPQYRQKTDPKTDPNPNVQYNTEVRSSSTNSTGWIIGGLVVLALIAAFFLWGGTDTPPTPTTDTTIEQNTVPPATPSTEEPATPETTQPQGSTEQPAPAPEQPATEPAPQGGTQGTTNP